ncbi:MAG: PHP domain-containing protein [Clostridium sp.]|nr:PHP domain-containing protein [Clostridium sp.]
MYKKGDFHLHTNASDGKLPSKKLLVLAKNEGLDIIAITDHDNTFGIDSALAAGSGLGVKVIPGIELSTRYNDENIHILGYFRDNSYKTPLFQKYLKDIQDYRIYRAKKIVDNLDVFFNIKINFEKLLLRSHGIIARPHIAKEIMESGYDYDFRYIFENFIGNNSPAYVPNKEISIQEGLDVLKSVNALTSLAHPTLIKKSPIEEIIKYDFDCIEAIYPLNKEGEEDYFIKLAQNHNKIITAGSDYHGLEKEDTKHGYIGRFPLAGNHLQNFLNKLKPL